MLSQATYPTAYVEASRDALRTHLQAYRELGTTSPAFEVGFVHHLVLALDNRFTHRGRGQEGRDGNPLNELRMLCDAIRADGTLTANSTIRYRPESSVLGIRIGDPVAVGVAEFTGFAEAVHDEVLVRYPET